MKKQTLYVLWGVLFALCAGLGFLPEPEGLLRSVLMGVSLLFFLPPALLIWGAVQTGDRPALLLVRNLSLASLGLTLAALALTMINAMGSEALGNALHVVLTIVSAPMIASGFWFLPLFLWACLLMVTIQQLKK